MPFSHWKDFDSCLADIREKNPEYSDEAVRRVCGKLKARLEKCTNKSAAYNAITRHLKQEVQKGDDRPDVAKAWEHNLPHILESKRVAEMTFHVPEVDKDHEFITADAMAKAIENYRHLPIISEFHKERPVGIAHNIWRTHGDEFKAVVHFREDPDGDDVWQKVQNGQYNRVSIAGRRMEYSQECNLHPDNRSADAPCRTTGLRLDSISVCDDNARNTQTDLHVVKAESADQSGFVYETKLVLTQVKDTLIKAETSDSSLIHPVTDGTKRKAGEKGVKMKKTKEKPVEEDEEKEEKEEKEEEAEKEEKGEAGSPEEEEMEKAPEPEPDKKDEAKAESESHEAAEETKLDKLIRLVEALVQSDKKVHAELGKADEEPPEEKKEVEKAEVPPPVPVVTAPEVKKAEMEQDFQKALDAAISPLKAEIEALKKANTDLAAKVDSYGNEAITKAGIVLSALPTKADGTPVLGNAGAMAAAMKQDNQ